MKSMVIKQFGDSSVFEEMVLPIPQVTSGHVLIKVKATSVNPLDLKLRSGSYASLINHFPMILHGDVAGIIEEVGPGVKNFSVGDEVYGCVGGLLDMSGALAEYVLADANLIAHKPKSISLTEAAALPLVALTAWEGLVTYANIQKNQTVLIHGGTGGVGHIAIQLAKSLGAKVFSTSSSPEKMDLIKKLGADGAIDYKKSDVHSYVSQYTNGAGFDVIFDTVGGDNLNKCIEAAALFGKIIMILAAENANLDAARLKGLSLLFVLQPLPLITGIRRKDYGEILTHIAKLVDQGKIRPLIDQQQFAIHQVGAAHDYLEKGQAVGKVVLTHI